MLRYSVMLTTTTFTYANIEKYGHKHFKGKEDGYGFIFIMDHGCSKSHRSYAMNVDKCNMNLTAWQSKLD